MSQSYTDVKIFLGGYNLSGFHNQFALTYGAELKDDTVFGTSGTRSNKPGLKTVETSGTILWDTSVDGVVYDRIGADREVMSMAPSGNAVGDRAFLVRAVQATYNPLSGEVGELLSSAFDSKSANTPLVRGYVLGTGSKAATGTGTSVLAGAIGATQKGYSSLHVTAIGATSIVVTVESASDAIFTSPTTRMTHTAFLGAGAIGADWQQVNGAITDTYWRSKWTMVGVGPFVIFHAFGIQ